MNYEKSLEADQIKEIRNKDPLRLFIHFLLLPSQESQSLKEVNNNPGHQ